MNPKAEPQPRRVAPGSPHMAGNRSAFPHRFHLTDGRVMTGNLYKIPQSRLADHLSTLKGYISSTDVECEQTGQTFAYIVINTAHILFIEEVADPPEESRFAPPTPRATPSTATSEAVRNGSHGHRSCP